MASQLNRKRTDNIIARMPVPKLVSEVPYASEFTIFVCVSSSLGY